MFFFSFLLLTLNKQRYNLVEKNKTNILRTKAMLNFALFMIPNLAFQYCGTILEKRDFRVYFHGLCLIAINQLIVNKFLNNCAEHWY